MPSDAVFIALIAAVVQVVTVSIAFVEHRRTATEVASSVAAKVAAEVAARLAAKQ